MKIHKTEKIFNFPKKIIIENAFDPYHVENVHKNTIKKCDVITQSENLSLLLYEVYVFPKFKFLRGITQKFLIIKEMQGDSCVQFISIPLKLKFVSKFIIDVEEVSKNETKYKATFFFQPFTYINKVFSSLILKLRNIGEEQRLKEDENLMNLRYQSLLNNFVDKPKCINKKMLIDEWFRTK